MKQLLVGSHLDSLYAIEDQLMTDDKGPIPPRVRASRVKARL